MDVSIERAKRLGLCFKCGKPGHFSNVCQNNWNYVHRFISALSPEDRQEFALAFSSLKEKAFHKAKAYDEEEEGTAEEEAVVREVVQEEEDFGKDHTMRRS